MTGLLTYFNGVEGDLCLRINRLSHRESVRRFFTVISKLGDGGFWTLMGAALFAIKGSPALPMILRMAMTAGVGILAYRLLKTRLVRERPFVNHRGILCGTAPLDRYSFPSGHTLHAVSFTTMLWSFEPALASVAAPFAVLVAASRIILGLHYPTDVLVGAAIGAGLASISLALN